MQPAPYIPFRLRRESRGNLSRVQKTALRQQF